MNLKNLFRSKSTTDENPAIKAMAARVSTLAGCQALEQELSQQRQALPEFSAQSRQLSRKLQELQRIQKALAMEEDRPRVAAVVKTDRDEATKGLKAAEDRLKTAREADKAAADDCAARATIIDQLNQQLAAQRAQADEAVTLAEADVRGIITDGQQGAEAEAQAFTKLREAQLQRATCGEDLAARVRAHETELRRLEGVAEAAAAQLQAAQDDVNRWRLTLARVECDQAAQLAVDAHLKMRALPQADGAGRLFFPRTLPLLDITFASRDRAVLGDKVCGEHAGLREYALADLARALAPADLAMLAEPLASEDPQEEAAPPVDPHSFTPGSMQFENAREEQKRRAMGAEAYEASLRAEQRAPLQA